MTETSADLLKRVAKLRSNLAALESRVNDLERQEQSPPKQTVFTVPRWLMMSLAPYRLYYRTTCFDPVNDGRACRGYDRCRYQTDEQPSFENLKHVYFPFEQDCDKDESSVGPLCDECYNNFKNREEEKEGKEGEEDATELSFEALKADYCDRFKDRDYRDYYGRAVCVDVTIVLECYTCRAQKIILDWEAACARARAQISREKAAK